MPKVSVIVPVYNVEKYIEKCLDSLVNQTLKDIELIIVNDGSTDSSEQIILKYKDKNSNIMYLTKENGGLSDARNFGIPYATGDYIAFLDSDDYVELSLYEKLYNKAIETNADMVECDFYWEYSETKMIHDRNARYKDKSDMYANARVVAWNKLYKREVLLNSGVQFPKGLRYEDLEFFYKILPKLRKIELIEEPLIHYVQRNNSITYTQNEKTRDIFTILDNIIDYYKTNNLYDEYKKELEYMYTRILFASSFRRMTKIADKSIKKECLKETIEKVYNTFPDWKKNKILRTSKGLKNFYLRSINKFTYKIYCHIF
ncbi:MAG: glycosyltransferase [Clostridia bacterium]|nr:glycosyltransferase [Clostridia bacterium]